MAYRFALASVLALRQRKEEQEERALAAFGAQMQQVQNTLQKVRSELRQANDERAREVGTARQAALQQSSYAHHSALLDAESQLLAELQKLTERRKQQQQVYRDARNAREMLAELKAEQHKAWQHEQLSVEQRRLEDIFNSRYTRK